MMRYYTTKKIFTLSQGDTDGGCLDFKMEVGSFKDFRPLEDDLNKRWTRSTQNIAK